MLTKSRKRLKPIPWNLVCATSLLSEDLSHQEWKKEIRKLIHKIPPTRKHSAIEVYDEEISKIIQEEMSIN